MMLLPAIHIVVLLFISILVISVTILYVVGIIQRVIRGGKQVKSEEGGNFTL